MQRFQCVLWQCLEEVTCETRPCALFHPPCTISHQHSGIMELTQRHSLRMHSCTLCLLAGEGLPSLSSSYAISVDFSFGVRPSLHPCLPSSPPSFRVSSNFSLCPLPGSWLVVSRFSISFKAHPVLTKLAVRCLILSITDNVIFHGPVFPQPVQSHQRAFNENCTKDIKDFPLLSSLKQAAVWFCRAAVNRSANSTKPIIKLWRSSTYPLLALIHTIIFHLHVYCICNVHCATTLLVNCPWNYFSQQPFP